MKYYFFRVGPHISFVDIEFEALVLKHKWTLSVSDYVVCVKCISPGKRTKTIFLYKLLLDTKQEVDHINGNKLDNRKENLRICSHSENCYNQSKSLARGSTSNYKGVFWHKLTQKWIAQIKIKGNSLHLLSSPVEEECAYAYAYASILIAKDFAKYSSTESLSDLQKNRIETSVKKRLATYCHQQKQPKRK